jgi:hypothetical protein
VGRRDARALIRGGRPRLKKRRAAMSIWGAPFDYLSNDGLFAETREQLGGYFIVDVRDLDEAIEIAGRLPSARLGTIEIRPILEIPGLPAH